MYEAELPSGRVVGKENAMIPAAPQQWPQSGRRQGVTKGKDNLLSYMLICLLSASSMSDIVLNVSCGTVHNICRAWDKDSTGFKHII